MAMSSSSRLIASVSRIVGTSRAMSGNAGPDLTGVYPPITTPFNEDESIAWDKLEQNIAKLNDTPLRGYLVQGSNGEYCYLTPQERVNMIEKVKKYAGANKLVLAGSGCESTQQTIDMTQAMAKVGADAAVVVTPCYFKAKMNGEALKQHYVKVAESVSVPVVLYSVPANTGIDLPVEVVRELSRHPNIIGIKESGGDIAKIGQMVHATQGENFQVIAGSASFLMAALHVGAVGGICALSNALPRETAALQQLVSEGKLEEATALQHRLIAPNGAVTKGFGVPGLKAAMEWFGFYGGPTRRPLLPLKPEEVQALRSTFTANGFL
eukprot:maker-scaffold360_size197209-snap-gene-0.34 protein:Tk00938 transcript:maker-scaffold360_size197209-snap-gene-0.34-mRNA-1 annotation:"probable 4-hydroxy-2-oxoglutarate mitochondrial-like isoform 1"